jgi:hypothetical protein
LIAAPSSDPPDAPRPDIALSEKVLIGPAAA